MKDVGKHGPVAAVAGWQEGKGCVAPIAQVMLQAGGDVKEEVWRACIVLLTNTPELHAYAARRLYAALRATASPLRSSAW